ncbi:MAG: NYN domain-containing protein [Patescibacteria group bacterium]
MLKSNNAIAFIDAANLEKSAQGRKIKINYRGLFAFLKNQFNCSQFRYYTVAFNNNSHQIFLKSLRAKGYILITKRLKIINQYIRKANFDVEITFDALLLQKNYNTIILFSGDSDFAYLLQKLKKLFNKKIIVFSTRYHIGKEIIESANKYYDIIKFPNIYKKQNTPTNK